MGRTWQKARGFWEHDPGLSAILVLLVLFVFVLPPLAPQGGERGALFDLVFALMVFAGVAGLRVGRTARGLLLALAVTATVVRWMATGNDAAVALASLASVGLLATVVMAQAFRAGPVNVHRVQGAVAAYLLLGVVWAYAYALLAAFAPDAFAAAGSVTQPFRGLQYFSFVTLTTMGYGDITPVHPIARSLATLEALTGQLYPAILLARLVSLQAQAPPRT